eukprot:4826188-Prymnesium_polylepis.2
MVFCKPGISGLRNVNHQSQVYISIQSIHASPGYRTTPDTPDNQSTRAQTKLQLLNEYPANSTTGLLCAILEAVWQLVSLPGSTGHPQIDQRDVAADRVN